MKLELPHPAAVELPAEVRRHNEKAPLRGLVVGPEIFVTFSTGYNLPDDEAVGGSIIHRKPDGSWCEGAIMFRAGYGPPVWSVSSWDPLTCEPSFACHCGTLHGFIRGGKWVPA